MFASRDNALLSTYWLPYANPGLARHFVAPMGGTETKHCYCACGACQGFCDHL
jgi:hypothetical protein